jgi:hypothetical protein
MSQAIEFMTPRLVGERFQGHAIPLEILKDLAVLEEMVIEVAKWKYLQEHLDRRRTPRGFTEDISIKMIAIGDGSAIANLVLMVGSISLLPSENQQYFEKARDAIINCIDAAEFAENNITQYLPSTHLAYFDRMGRSLRDNESIEFNPMNKQKPARLNRLTRHKLLEMSLVKEWTEEIVERGMVPEVDQDKKRFTLQLLNGIKIQMPLEPQHKEVILEAFIGFDQKIKIIAHGVGRYNKMHRLESFDSVEHIAILDALDVSTRLAELAMLQNGWLDGKGQALDQRGLKWLAKVFDDSFSPVLPLPRIFPTPEGCVIAEWTIGNYEISLEVVFETKNAEFQAINMLTKVVDETTFDLSNTESWTALNAKIDAIQKESV